MQNFSLWIRIPVTALIVSGLTALVVSIFGWISRWSLTQFSNGMFYAGMFAILIAVIFSFNRKSTMPGYYKTKTSSEKIEANLDGIKLWIEDMRRGYNAFLLMTLVGILLVGLSVWIATYVI